MSATVMPPIEKADGDEAGNNNVKWSLTSSSSTSALIDEDDNNVDDSNVNVKPKGKTSLPMGHSSRSSMDIIESNKQDPIQMNDDIMPSVPYAPAMSQHYIGYHPEKLYKVKGRMHNSEGVSFLPGDRLAVADKHDGHIMIYDNQGNFEKMLLKGIKPCGIATNRSGIIAFTDNKSKKDRTVKVYTEDGNKVSEFGSKFDWKPRGITVSNKGLLVVTDIQSKKNCIGIYTIDGKVMSQFGVKGSGKEELEDPLYVYMDIRDRILISDRTHHCVKVFDDNGRFLGLIGHRGSGAGCLLNPRGVTEDAFGNILVCDTGNRRVCAFTHQGHFIKHLLEASDGVQYPVDIAFSRQSGKLAVTMHKANGEFHKLRVYQLPNIDSEQKLKKVF